MKIKEVLAKIILDSRKEKTIEVSVKTEAGLFLASSPSGKSKGKFEKPSYVKDIKNDIETIKNTKINFEIECFDDLEKIENILEGKIGANTLFALETSLLKALASEQGKQLWQVINEKARKMPFPVGNCIGGGLHTSFFRGKKPDFQEFLIIPKTRNFSDCVFVMKKAYEDVGKRLELRKALGKLNDENAFSTFLTNNNALDVLNETRDDLVSQLDLKIEIGIDIAASTFYTGLVYNYKNPAKRLKAEEQINYLSDLADKFRISYIEDPLQEKDFSNFMILRKKINLKRPCLIVGDDLIASQLERLKKALLRRSVNAIIVKPNQSGSLIEIKKLIDLAKKYEIATIMSHRSGETLDYALADLAFGFSCDFIKTGIKGKERETKLNRLIDIEAGLNAFEA